RNVNQLLAAFPGFQNAEGVTVAPCEAGDRTLVAHREPSWVIVDLITEHRIQAPDGNIGSFFIDYEPHEFPGAAGVILPPEVSGKLWVSDFRGDFSSKANATAVVNQHNVTR